MKEFNLADKFETHIEHSKKVQRAGAIAQDSPSEPKVERFLSPLFSFHIQPFNYFFLGVNRPH